MKIEDVVDNQQSEVSSWFGQLGCFIFYIDQENKQACQHPPTPANLTPSVTNALDEAWFRRLPHFREIKKAAARVDIDN